MLFDTRVSISSTPGCEHRWDGGVKGGEMGVLYTICSYIAQIKSPVLEKYLG